MKLTIFRGVAPSSLVEVACLAHFGLEDGSSTFFRNFDEFLPDYTASHSRR
jgi:hypothetical protein